MAASEPRLTPEIRNNLLRWLRGGLPLDVASRLAGTREATVRVWRSKSVARRRGYIGFDEDVTHAMAEGESILVARITAAGKTNWRADAWLLERMYPDRYGPPAPPADIPDAPPLSAEADEFAGL